MMVCPVVHTGEDFLAAALAHIDCQAETIGAYGFGALASPGSPVTVAITALLTIFIALFGIRLLLGYPMAARDMVGDAIKVGIVLTLATSWPAWRTAGYDLVVDGPAQIADVIGRASALPGSTGDLASRLQNADKGLAAMNTHGSGRLGVAQGDWFQLGFARTAFLAGTLGPLALVRLTAGFLLAVTPLMAGLLLFGITRGIFEGWARALVMTFLASMMLSVIYGAELALIEPWLQNALEQRTMDRQTLDAPVEILVAALSFTLAALGGLFVIARLSFHQGWSGAAAVFQVSEPAHQFAPPAGRAVPIAGSEPSRAVIVAQSVSENLRREERISDIIRGGGHWNDRPQSAPAVLAVQTDQARREAPLGTSWRRPAARASKAAHRRDQA